MSHFPCHIPTNHPDIHSAQFILLVFFFGPNQCESWRERTLGAETPKQPPLPPAEPPDERAADSTKADGTLAKVSEEGSNELVEEEGSNALEEEEGSDAVEEGSNELVEEEGSNALEEGSHVAAESASHLNLGELAPQVEAADADSEMVTVWLVSAEQTQVVCARTRNTPSYPYPYPRYPYPSPSLPHLSPR